MALLEAIRQRFQSLGSNAQNTPARLTDLGSLAVDMVLPAHAELTRAGRRFGAVVGNGATYKAPIQAIPTTTATWALYNGETGAQAKSYIIDLVSCFSASGTLGLGLTLLGAVTKGPQTAVTSNYSGVVTGSLSGSSQSTKAYLSNNVSIINGTPVWLPLEARDQVSAVSVGSGLVHRNDGRFIVPPGYSFVMDVLAPTGTSALFGVGVTWAEALMELE